MRAAMIPKPFDAVTFDDVERLIAEQAQESRTLEFKRDAIGGRDADRVEFLADVSAFANTVGGDLIIGIEQRKDEPSAASVAIGLPGLSLSNPDQEILKLTEIVRAGLDP